jgi:exodeoxyribonuclease VII large subunit
MTGVDEAWTVTRLAQVIKRRVEDGFPSIWVRGEISGVKRYPSGHWYFSLHDQTAKVDCTLWRTAAARLSAPPAEGAEVFAFGTASVWEERTALRFNVRQLLPAAAVGAKVQRVEEIKQRLLADGLLDPARKRALPPFPSRLAVVTSVAGAAVHDIITVARRRWPAIELLVVNSAVQGENAPAELVHALGVVARLERVDCCIVGRGGGGRDDLAAFNDEAVCRAIAACPVPVISAVGHEVDITLADLVADRRAATPSQAAEFALPDRADVEQLVGRAQSALVTTVRGLLAIRGERLERTGDRLAHGMLHRMAAAERRLALVRARLMPALERTIERPRARLGQAAAQLQALSPLAVLGRGYAVVRDENGRILRRTADFLPRSRVAITVADGMVAARVEE